MIRIESIFFAGMLAGALVALVASWLWRRYLAMRDASVKQALVNTRVAEALEKAPTEELLNELSTRDDLRVNTKR